MTARKQNGEVARDAGVREKKKPGRKKGDGGRNNPASNPTPLQREQQEKAFYLSLEGRSVREIAAELDLGYSTAAKYVRIEEERRQKQTDADRERNTMRAIETYETIKRRAFKKSDRIDELMESAVAGENVRVTDHSLDPALKAQERIDRIRGIDAPLKVDAGIEKLVSALDARD